MKNYLIRMSSEDLAFMKGLVAYRRNEVLALDWKGSDHEFSELMYRLDSARGALQTPSILGGKQK